MMTSPLDLVKARWVAASGTPQFLDTVNEQPSLDGAPDTWGSALVNVEARRDVTMGSNPYVEESGSIVVGLFTRAGSGYGALDDEVNAVRLAFHGYVVEDAVSTFQCLQVDGPLDVEPETDGEWWRVALTIPYTYQTRRTEPVA